jgi:hypothetical protein
VSPARLKGYFNWAGGAHTGIQPPFSVRPPRKIEVRLQFLAKRLSHDDLAKAMLFVVLATRPIFDHIRVRFGYRHDYAGHIPTIIVPALFSVLSPGCDINNK